MRIRRGVIDLSEHRADRIPRALPRAVGCVRAASRRVLACASTLLFVFAVTGCASVHVTGRDDYQGEKLARLNWILVRDFSATPEDLPSWSVGATGWAERAVERSGQEVAVGRSLGGQMASDLVVRIRRMGLSAERMLTDDEPESGDIVIVGYLTSIEQGSAAKRVALGFGSGAAEIATEIEGYLVTDEGFVKLSSGRAESVKSRGPGAVVPAASMVVTANPISLIVGLPVKVAGEASGRSTVEGVDRRMVAKIADELEKKFRSQDWID